MLFVETVNSTHRQKLGVVVLRTDGALKPKICPFKISIFGLFGGLDALGTEVKYVQ
jgi:hypothetical protein